MQRWLKRARDVVAVVGLALWFWYAGLVISWSGHRPLTPDATHPYPFANHGVLYVTTDDLRLSNAVLTATLAALAIAVVLTLVGRALSRDFK
jgi:hypothetical protein